MGDMMSMAAIRNGFVVAMAAIAVIASAPSAQGTNPVITLSIDSATPGTEITIAGSGFPAGEIVALYIDSPQPYLGQPGPVADASGSFKVLLKLPGKEYDKTGRVDPSTPGQHQICGDTGYPGSAQAVAVKACATLTVLALPSPSPSPAATPQNSTSPQLPVPAILAAFLVLAILAGALLFFTRRPPDESGR